MSQAALISPQLNADEQARVDAIFSDIESKMGFVPAGLKLYSVSPPLLEAFLGNVGYFMAHPDFRQEFLATVRYLVSSTNNCRFCIDFNLGILGNQGVDLDAVRAAREDASKAPLESREIALLQHVLKTLEQPASQTKESLETLKQLGWSEREIFEAILIGSNNRSFTTMLKAFNVEDQDAFA
ncbi:MAG: carboxymuconolactone decarboxylase family protein [bacterium]